MREILARCGYRCDLCLAYRANVEKKDQRAVLQAGWKKYFDLKFAVEAIICDGCLSCSETARRIDTDCPVRPCATAQGLEHCGQCRDYPCARFEERRGHTMDIARELAGASFKAAEFRQCVRPYDNGTRLDSLRQEQNRLVLLTNPHIIPDLNNMLKFIGPPVSELFARMVAVVKSQEDLALTVKYGGKNYGWEISVRRGSRPIVSLTPRRAGFTVLCIMGKKEIAAFANCSDLFSAKAKKQVADTKMLHDGKWISYLVEAEADLRNAIAFMALKRWGNKAREAMASLPSGESAIPTACEDCHVGR